MEMNRHCVLVGGGHAHLEALRRLPSKMPGEVELLLISDLSHSTYSGMVPGCIAGHYRSAEAEINLPELCKRLNVQFHQSAVVSIEPSENVVTCADGREFPYSVLSLDIGAAPDISITPGAEAFAISLKPINKLIEKLHMVIPTIQDGSRISIVGGGAGGIEVALALQYRLNTVGKTKVELTIITESADILSNYDPAVRKRFRRILSGRKVRMITGERITSVTRTELRTISGAHYSFDWLLWATAAAPTPWVRATGIATDDKGFVSINEFLQSTSHPEIFATGDVATLNSSPYPTAGVFAVRQGPILARNLLAYLCEQSLTAYRPQSRYLSLISTGDKCAVASRGSWSAEGKWVWWLKDKIDRTWLNRYRP